MPKYLGGFSFILAGFGLMQLLDKQQCREAGRTVIVAPLKTQHNNKVLVTDVSSSHFS